MDGTQIESCTVVVDGSTGTVFRGPVGTEGRKRIRGGHQITIQDY